LNESYRYGTYAKRFHEEADKGPIIEDVMTTNFLHTNARRRSHRDSENFSIPMTLLFSGLLSATAWAGIAAVVMLVR
jgi:hypothetical protein